MADAPCAYGCDVPQHQGPLNEQLALLVPVANQLGLYDAADYLQNVVQQKGLAE